jgi:hypothetical protein
MMPGRPRAQFAVFLELEIYKIRTGSAFCVCLALAPVRP